MKNDLSVFLLGILTGTLLTVFFMVIIGKTPRDVYQKYTTEAIQLGYGKWVVDTNNFQGDMWTPSTRFEWITNHIESR